MRININTTLLAQSLSLLLTSTLALAFQPVTRSTSTISTISSISSHRPSVSVGVGGTSSSSSSSSSSVALQLSLHRGTPEKEEEDAQSQSNRRSFMKNMIAGSLGTLVGASTMSMTTEVANAAEGDLVDVYFGVGK